MSVPLGSPLVFWMLAALGAAAIALALWGWWGDRARGRARCPRCWYDLSALRPDAPPACPECGWHSRDRRDLFRTRRRRRAVALGLTLAAAAMAWPLGRTVVRAFTPLWTVTFRTVIPGGGGYEVLLLDASGADAPPVGMPRMVRVLHRGRTVFQMAGAYFEVGGQYGPPPGWPGAAPPAPGAPQRIGLGDDVTGDGRPDLVLVMLTGGSGGMSRQYIFTLDNASTAPTLEPESVIPFPGWFEDVNADHAPEFVAFDSTFAYRWTSGAASPRPRVILRCIDGAWVGAPDLMRRPAPTEAELAAWIAEDRTPPDPTPADPGAGSFEHWAPRPLRRALDLVYSGHRDLALRYLRDVWPDRFADQRQQRLAEFQSLLSASPFANELEALQHPPKP